MKYTSLLLLGAATATEWTDEWGTGETGIIDKTTAPEEYCEERLWLDQHEIDWQVEMFSRTCDSWYWENAKFIAGKIKGTLPRVKTWKLFNNMFAFSRIRRYPFVEEQMNVLEHFQDNLNLNPYNNQNRDNFTRACWTTRFNIESRYQHNGYIDYPW